MKNKQSISRVFATITGLATISVMPAHAAVLSYLPFDGGTIGQSLADTTAIGGGAIGFTSDFTAITSAGNSNYTTGLTGSMGGSGNAFQAGFGGSHRNRMIIDRTTAAYVASGVVDGSGLVGANGSSIFGSVLIANPNGAPTGFTGLEFAIGNPDSNRKITLGEGTGAADWVVIGSGAAGTTATLTNLALPTASAATREIVFRIDFGAADLDTFTLINSDGTDGVTSATSNLTFSTLHLASFSGAPAVTYDEIRLGTTLADVTTVVPEPSVALLGSLGLLGLLRRRR